MRGCREAGQRARAAVDAAVQARALLLHAEDRLQPANVARLERRQAVRVQLRNTGPFATVDVDARTRMTLLENFQYSQYYLKVLSINSGLVALKKFRPTTSLSGSLRRPLNRVIVLLEPGGSQSIRGPCSESHE